MEAGMKGKSLLMVPREAANMRPRCSFRGLGIRPTTANVVASLQHRLSQLSNNCSKPHSRVGSGPSLQRYAVLTDLPKREAAGRSLKANAQPAGASNVSQLERRLGHWATGMANLFPLWLIVVGGAALAYPPVLLWFCSRFVTAGLAVTMLTMGTTLSFKDFDALAKMPYLVALGAALQYTIMPLIGFTVSRLAGLPEAFAVGICIVASCPGGVASNVVTFLANADVPLSVAMTTVSTLMAVVATPALTRVLVGTLVPVDPSALLLSTLQVVLLPIAVGAWLNYQFPQQVQRASPFAPLMAVTMTVLICGSILAVNAAAVQQAGPRLLAAVAILHSGGFLLGYWASRFCKLDERKCRTNCIEVGMQNSALGAVLASLHFADPLTPVPCAISACCHSLIGSAIAAFFRSRGSKGDGNSLVPA